MKSILITAWVRARNQGRSKTKPWTCREANIPIPKFWKTILVVTTKPSKPEWTSKGCSRTLSCHLWSTQWPRRIIFSTGNSHASIKNQEDRIIKVHLRFLKLNLLSWIVLNIHIPISSSIHNLTPPRLRTRKYLKNPKLRAFAIPWPFLVNTKTTCKCDLFKRSALQQSPKFKSKSWVKTAASQATRWTKSK